ncbi:thioredoxin family protein, partial [Staphylococcus aureus]
LNTVQALLHFIDQHPVVVLHVMCEQCSVCHAVLPQIADLIPTYPHVPIILSNICHGEDIAGGLNSFPVYVESRFVI